MTDGDANLQNIWDLTLRILDQNFTSRCAGMVLGIYLIHPIAIEALKSHGIYAPAFHVLISIPLISIAVFAASAVLAWLIQMCPYVEFRTF